MCQVRCETLLYHIILYICCWCVDNILIQRVGGLSASAGAMSVYDGSMDEGLGEESIDELDHTMYKIGDLGQVASVMCQSVDEGDCRYLPCELLADQSDDLPKADVFSLALTVLEAGSGVDLPPNGPLWHEYRRVGIPDLPHVSAEFNALLKVGHSSSSAVCLRAVPDSGSGRNPAPAGIRPFVQIRLKSGSGQNFCRISAGFAKCHADWQTRFVYLSFHAITSHCLQDLAR